MLELTIILFLSCLGTAFAIGLIIVGRLIQNWYEAKKEETIPYLEGCTDGTYGMVHPQEKQNDFKDREEMKKPKIVCLCGSTRFYETFQKANFELTLAGYIVLSIGCDFKSDQALGLMPEDKKRLDELHLCKIDLADEVLILNVQGYIGESTRNELNYARKKGKEIKFLEPEAQNA